MLKDHRNTVLWNGPNMQTVFIYRYIYNPMEVGLVAIIGGGFYVEVIFIDSQYASESMQSSRYGTRYHSRYVEFDLLHWTWGSDAVLYNQVMYGLSALTQDDEQFGYHRLTNHHQD